MDLFGKYGGYRKLDSFTLATVIQLGNLRFCTTFLNRKIDPTGRQFDQMTQAARSGRVNIAEGSERASTSTETEQVDPDAPECPDCGQPMRRRIAKSGRNAGKPFWGCTAFPDCKGTREIET